MHMKVIWPKDYEIILFIWYATDSVWLWVLVHCHRRGEWDPEPLILLKHGTQDVPASARVWRKWSRTFSVESWIRLWIYLRVCILCNMVRWTVFCSFLGNVAAFSSSVFLISLKFFNCVKYLHCRNCLVLEWLPYVKRLQVRAHEALSNL